MFVGAFLVLLGVLILVWPQLLIAAIAGFLVCSGLGVMALSWQFRRMRRRSESAFVNWISRW